MTSKGTKMGRDGTRLRLLARASARQADGTDAEMAERDDEGNTTAKALGETPSGAESGGHRPASCRWQPRPTCSDRASIIQAFYHLGGGNHRSPPPPFF